MSEELVSSYGPVLGKIVAIIVGIGGLFAFSKTGVNSYTFEIGDNLLTLLLSALFIFFLLQVLSAKGERRNTHRDNETAK